MNETLWGLVLQQKSCTCVCGCGVSVLLVGADPPIGPSRATVMGTGVRRLSEQGWVLQGMGCRANSSPICQLCCSLSMQAAQAASPTFYPPRPPH